MSDEKNIESPAPEKDATGDVDSPEVGAVDEKKEENGDEEQGEATQNDVPEDDSVDDSKDKQQNESAKKGRKVKILTWTGIILLPMTAIAVLFFLKPAFIINIFNKQELQLNTSETAAAAKWTAEELEMIHRAKETLAETEKIWNTIFTQKGGIYKSPKFTFFSDRISSVCKNGNNEKLETEKKIDQSFIGTFYCPEENHIYIDLSLQQDLKNRLDIPGDFTQGYIIAHEIGHHIQNLAGISEQVPAARLELGDKEFAMILQRIELQADCFAGIWAQHTAEQTYNTSRNEFADVLDAVTHYSREHLKQKDDNDMMPDPFTHSSSRLRLRWFTIGYDKGTFDACDTFTVMEL